jgi:hypothetical protein
MSLRFAKIDRLAFLTLLAALSCSESEPGGGSGGAGGNAGAGMNGGGTATGGAGSSAGGAGSSAGGTGGTSAGGAGSSAGGTGGTSAGGAGSSAGGTGGTSAGSGGTTAGAGGGSGGSGGEKSKTTFFVTSDKSTTGKLGGLDGADKRCQDLAKAAGFGDHTFHAYLSTSTVNAKDRIGQGPWFNSAGVMLAANLTALHALKGNAELFLDENKKKINGQWQGSPTPNEHDILTGTEPDGTVSKMGYTCMDWTSDAASVKAQVGHSDGLGPGGDPSGNYGSWNSSHDNQDCSNTSPKGGAGKLYCFAID